MAAIIGTHRATKNESEPSPVRGPMSIPLICRRATTQAATASSTVAEPAAAMVSVRRLDACGDSASAGEDRSGDSTTITSPPSRAAPPLQLRGATTGRWGVRPATLTLVAKRASRR